ncbi:hypothetical protein NQZ68_020038 [Dissostichus eleginoides]|nr:hypothetical protein NQZ68_020038 [Dissostichus eleginoides]
MSVSICQPCFAQAEPGGKAQLELVAVFPETGSDAGQATLNSSAGFMVSKVDRHEDFVSVGQAADTGSTDKSLSRSLKKTLVGSEVICLDGGRPCGMT